MTFGPEGRSASPSAVARRVVGVKRLADYVKRKLENDVQLRNVSVRGEISNLQQRPSYANFSLKEGEALLSCFAFDAVDFPELKNGMAVIATGSVSAYVNRSLFQLLVRELVQDGVGDVHALFAERKKRLTAEGLFDPARKRALPRYPFRVALVSSRQAKGAEDFVTLLHDRAPHVEVVWCETAVQGPNAPLEICAALRRAARADVDAIVVTRGGGSFEDLFAFSDESVVRAVAAARHPVLSAIGHTADQQLCDFAADVRVETPSAAAKALGADTRDLLRRIEDHVSRGRTAASLRVERAGVRLTKALVRSKLSEPRAFFAPLLQRLGAADEQLASRSAAGLRAREEYVRELARRLAARDPSRRLAERGARLQAARTSLDAAARARLAAARLRYSEAERRLRPAVLACGERAARKLELLVAHLDGKDPEAILQRGYAIVTSGTRIVRDAAEVPPGAPIVARLGRGTLRARVEREEADGNQRIG